MPYILKESQICNISIIYQDLETKSKKEIKKEYDRQWKKENKDRTKIHSKTFYEKNIDKYKEKTHCNCGGTYT